VGDFVRAREALDRAEAVSSVIQKADVNWLIREAKAALIPDPGRAAIRAMEAKS